jgi:hypothetical protein
MTGSNIKTLTIACLLALVSCKQETREQAASPPSTADAGGVVRVGSVTVTQEDLDYQLKEVHAGRSDAGSRQAALDELTDRARLTQAARDAGIDKDPVARAEIARILAGRLREKELDPKLKAVATTDIPESRLQEIYESRKDQFRAVEKRQVAVLWLNPGTDPERTLQYQAKLAQARDWYLANSEVVGHPDQGFSVLSVDYSEHAPSRYKNGVVGWLQREGGMDDWSKAVAEIAFSLKQSGDITEVVTRPEGVFLVRCMAVTPEFFRPFESVSSELEQSERQRLIQAAETDFAAAIKSRYPASPLVPDVISSQALNTP